MKRPHRSRRSFASSWKDIDGPRIGHHPDQDPNCYGQAIECLRRQDSLIGQLQNARVQGEQVADEVATVNRGNITRRKGLEAARVVPIEEVAAKPLQAFHCLEAVGGPLLQLRR